VCEEVKDITDEVRSDIEGMIKVLEAHSNGIGIAANQCGVFHRVILVRKDVRGPITVMINPAIIGTEDTQVIDDGCLSIPGYTYKTTRAKLVGVTWQDISGKEYSDNFMGIESAIIQHEIDHLDGTLFIDHLNRNARKKFYARYGKEK